MRISLLLPFDLLTSGLKSILSHLWSQGNNNNAFALLPDILHVANELKRLLICVLCVGALQLFKGTFYYCEGADVRAVKTKADCLQDPHNHWVNRKYNFDNLGQVSIWQQTAIRPVSHDEQ